MKWFFLFSFWSKISLVATGFVAVAAFVGIFELHIGPVVLTVAGTHGIHAGDAVITAIAAFLVVLLTIGIVPCPSPALTRRPMQRRPHARHRTIEHPPAIP